MQRESVAVCDEVVRGELEASGFLGLCLKILSENVDLDVQAVAGYKRAANILKKEDYVAPAKAGAAGLSGEDGSSNAATPASAGATLSYTPEPAEADLIAALDAAGPAAADAVANEDFEAAMAALATLRAPIDAFFDAVTVNDADHAKRAARLALLARVRDAVHSVADFSKIEG